MNKGTKKMVIGAVAVAAVGIVGYFGYKAYKQSQSVAGLGAFTDGGYADYNAQVAARYWKRMQEQYAERQRIQASRGL